MFNSTTAVAGGLTTEEKAYLSKHFKRHYNGKFGKIWFNSKTGALVCQLTQPYVPIEEFKSIFVRMAALVKKEKLTRFVFDKRLLKSFHQPSMEWYFVVWKAQMAELGLRTHRKMLPPEPWFEQAVIAGKADILAKHPTSVSHTLDIQYRTSLLACLED
jgi:hypothetical protein